MFLGDEFFTPKNLIFIVFFVFFRGGSSATQAKTFAAHCKGTLPGTGYWVAGDTVFVQLAPLSFVVVVGAPGMGYGEGATRAITPHLGAVTSPFRISIRET